MRQRLSIFLLVIGLCAMNAHATTLLYAGLGGHSNGDSTNDGALGTVNQLTGVVSILGPTGVARISGLAFDGFGALYAASQGAGGFPPPPGPTTTSQLLRLNPLNGAPISSVPITIGGVAISIADLAVQPGTGALFGIRGPNDQLGGQGRLYTISKTTGVATLIGDTGDFFGSIAFAPNGTLYMGVADLDFVTGNLINIGLKTLNPSTAATLTFIPTLDFLSSLAVRPEDSALFGGNGDFGQLFRVNPATGAETLLGSTGRNFVGDLAFAPIPEPASLGLVVCGLIGFALARRRLSTKP